MQSKRVALAVLAAVPATVAMSGCGSSSPDPNLHNMKNLQHKIAQGYPKPKQDSLTNSGDVLQFVDCDRAGPNYARCEVKLNDGTTSEYEIHIGKNGQHYTSRQLGFSIVEN